MFSETVIPSPAKMTSSESDTFWLLYTFSHFELKSSIKKGRKILKICVFVYILFWSLVLVCSSVVWKLFPNYYYIWAYIAMFSICMVYIILFYFLYFFLIYLYFFLIISLFNFFFLFLLFFIIIYFLLFFSIFFIVFFYFLYCYYLFSIILNCIYFLFLFIF